jgi:hypothetical protein
MWVVAEVNGCFYLAINFLFLVSRGVVALIRSSEHAANLATSIKMYQ